MLAFHEPPLAVIAPVTKFGNTAGRYTRFHFSQPVRPRLSAARRSSVGSVEAPATTLNRMYHWVPNTINGLSQMLGDRCACTSAYTTIGNIRLTGKAARNWAS